PGPAARRGGLPQHQHLQPGPVRHRRLPGAAVREGRRPQAGHRARRPPRRRGARGAHPLRRQPAEGRAGPLAAARLPGAAARRAHPRRRRRRAVGDLRADPGAGRPRRRGRRRLERDPRGPRPGRPGARDRRRRRHRGTAGRRPRRARGARHGHGRDGRCARRRLRHAARRGPRMSTTTSATTGGTAATAPPERNGSGRAGLMSGPFVRLLGLIVALVILCLVGVITAGDRFADIDNVLTILRLASVIGVVSVGMTFVIIGGGIDLSVGAIVALSSVWATTVATQQMAENFHWIVMVITAILVGAGTGLVNGLVIAYGKLAAFIATLAMLAAARGLAEIMSDRRTQII